MSQTKSGAIKAKRTLLKREPDFYKRVGALGGKASGTGGFFANRELAREAGKKGGRKSRKPTHSAVKGSYAERLEKLQADDFMDYEFLDNNEPLFKPAKTLLDRIKIWDKR